MNRTDIYLDLEDDITSVIDKVRSADSSVVALIPPKRMPVFQSTVNLKLLLKGAKDASKKVVVISSEPGLLPLAGTLGLHVADDLKSRPYIPEVKTDSAGSKGLVINDTTDEEFASGASESETETADLNDATDTKDNNKAKKEKSEKSSFASKFGAFKTSIPNFEKFRLRLILIITAVILLIVGIYFALFVAPNAKVLLNAQTSRIPISFVFTLDSKLEADNIEEKIIPSVTQILNKTISEEVTATGTRNDGTKSTGLIEIRNCDYADGFTVAANTTFTSNGGFKFKTDESVFVPSFSGSSSDCEPNEAGSTWGSGTVGITAIAAGDTYNLAPQSYGFNVGGKVAAIGSQMTGGTTKIVKVLSQNDVDSAVAKLTAKIDDVAAKSELIDLFTVKVVPLEDSFSRKIGDTKSTPAIGQEATTASVTLAITYTMKSVTSESLDALFASVLEEEIADKQLSIYDTGVDATTFSVKGNTVTAKTNGFVGPEIDLEALAVEITGLRFSAAVDLLEAKSGIRTAEIELSPFWVFSLPKAEKIQITVEIAEHALQ